jgi:glycosyltransferase involved in cell wall biosynthesis
MSRWLLKTCDRATATLASFVLVDSPSQRDFLIAEKVVASRKSHVLGMGSVAGVDPQRFHPNARARVEVRMRHGIGPDELVFLFLGRLNRDKGVLELAEAFGMMSPSAHDRRLLFVGPDEEGLTEAVSQLGGADVIAIPSVPDPESYLVAADVLCLPSHREGFGNVVIEAASVGIPSVASRIYGLTDAVVDGETGILHPPGDVLAISDALGQLATDTQRRLLLGKNARARALTDFPESRILGELRLLYENALDECGRDSARGTSSYD